MIIVTNHEGGLDYNKDQCYRLTFMKKSVGGKIPRQMESRVQPCRELLLFLLFTSCLQI